MTQLAIVNTAGLFRPLHDELIRLLETLPPQDWLRPTVAGQWRVRDVVAHLIDTDLRRVSAQRDAHHGRPPATPIDSYQALVVFQAGTATITVRGRDLRNGTWK